MLYVAYMLFKILYTISYKMSYAISHDLGLFCIFRAVHSSYVGRQRAGEDGVGRTS